jgi:hypothetical protein
MSSSNSLSDPFSGPECTFAIVHVIELYNVTYIFKLRSRLGS